MQEAQKLPESKSVSFPGPQAVRKEIILKVNGDWRRVSVKAKRTLLELLRQDLGLTGTKCGCNTGDCGACTVLLDGKTINSCLVLAWDAYGREVVTIEGLSNGIELHPLQRAFVELGALQCGFCTPGMVLTSKALLDENPLPSEEEVRDALAGNLCRCTGYQKIIEAVLRVAAENAKAAERAMPAETAETAKTAESAQSPGGGET